MGDLSRRIRTNDFNISEFSRSFLAPAYYDNADGLVYSGLRYVLVDDGFRNANEIPCRAGITQSFEWWHD